MKALERFVKGDMHGIHYAVSVFFAIGVLSQFGRSARWLPPASR